MSTAARHPRRWQCPPRLAVPRWHHRNAEEKVGDRSTSRARPATTSPSPVTRPTITRPGYGGSPAARRRPSAAQRAIGIVVSGGRIDKPLVKAGCAYHKFKAIRLTSHSVDHPHSENHQHIGKASTVAVHHHHHLLNLTLTLLDRPVYGQSQGGLSRSGVRGIIALEPSADTRPGNSPPHVEQVIVRRGQAKRTAKVKIIRVSNVMLNAAAAEKITCHRVAMHRARLARALILADALFITEPCTGPSPRARSGSPRPCRPRRSSSSLRPPMT
jgi:hypothetical protein